MKYSIAILTLGLIIGCAQQGSKPEKKELAKVTKGTLCTDPRPQMCTMEYDPVCATSYNGNIQTYSNGCMACADKQVRSYVHGACPRSTDKPVLHRK